MRTAHFAKDFFTTVTNWPKTIVAIGMVAIFGMVSFIPSLRPAKSQIILVSGCHHLSCCSS